MPGGVTFRAVTRDESEMICSPGGTPVCCQVSCVNNPTWRTGAVQQHTSVCITRTSRLSDSAADI